MKSLDLGTQLASFGKVGQVQMSKSGQTVVTAGRNPDYDVTVFYWGGSSYSIKQKYNQVDQSNPGGISGNGKVLFIAGTNYSNAFFYSRS